LSLPSGLLPSGLLTKILYAPLRSPIHYSICNTKIRMAQLDSAALRDTCCGKEMDTVCVYVCAYWSQQQWHVWLKQKDLQAVA
jgi:hypothetical protein